MGSFSEDGGAFAECFFAQYPLGMGRKPVPSYLAGVIAGRGNQHAAEKTRTPFVDVAAAASSLSVPSPSPHAAGGALVVSSLTSFGGTTALTAASGAGGNMSGGDGEELARTTEKTKEALATVMRSRETQKEYFSGRNIRRAQREKPALEIMLPGDVGSTGMHDPAPIVRSPTRAKNKDRGSSDDGSGASSSTLDSLTSVPFSIGNWKNKRKLIIPLEQRLAQQSDTSADGSDGISEQVMNLAVAMQQARKEVEAEQAAREKAHQEEEERRHAEREAEATRRAKELLEKTALDMMQASTQRRHETREERLERIKLERELREREKQQEGRQRRLAKAATRLGITVEALEADEELLKTVDEAAAAAGGVSHNVNIAPSHSVVKQEGRSEDQRLPSLYAEDETDGARHASGIRKGVFGSAVISNEGIRREMEALAKMEEQQNGVKDGIQIFNGNEPDDDDDDELGMNQLMKRRRRM